MVKNEALLEAVNRYIKTDEEFQAARIALATLLREAARNRQITELAKLTKIKRPTIYWLIKTWSNSANGSTRDNLKES